MKTYAVPGSDLTVSSVVLGLMRIANMSDADIQRLVGTALDAGITVFDHADVYGGARIAARSVSARPCTCRPSRGRAS